VLSYNYKSCSTVLVYTDVNVVAAYADLCVCVCVYGSMCKRSEYAAITLTTSVSTRTAEHDL